MEEKQKKQINQYVRFSGLALQMGGIIGFFAWLGVFLDGKYNAGGNAWTIGLTLFGVAGSMFMVIKEVIKMSNNDK